MRSPRRFTLRLLRDEAGNYAIEFAVVAPVLIAVVMALYDLGYRTYMGSVVEGALNRAARLATVGNKSSADIDSFIYGQLAYFSQNGNTVQIQKTNYYNYAGVNKPEILTLDNNGNGVWDSGDCYQDLNGNKKWDSVSGRDGLGGSNDIVLYKVSVTYTRFLPMTKLMGWSPQETVTANTVLRNQPYGSQAIPSVICTSS